MPEIVERPRTRSIPRRIRAEAERRMQAGIPVGGSPFRCDDRSVQRMDEFARMLAERKSEPDAIVFRTGAGRTVRLKDADTALAINDAQRRYRAACLKTSAALQDSPPPDPEADRHWPDPGRYGL